jgi:predicted GIY-YIG superfamily endonuclease
VKQPAVYIMASRRNGTLYAGVTSNLTTQVGGAHPPKAVIARSNATKRSMPSARAGLRRCARNDDAGGRGAPLKSRHCEERSDEAIHLAERFACFSP